MLCTRCIDGVFAVSMMSDLLRSREGAWAGRGAAVGGAGRSTAAATASAVRRGQQMLQHENMAPRTELAGSGCVTEYEMTHRQGRQRWEPCRPRHEQATRQHLEADLLIVRKPCNRFRGRSQGPRTRNDQSRRESAPAALLTPAGRRCLPLPGPFCPASRSSFSLPTHLQRSIDQLYRGETSKLTGPMEGRHCSNGRQTPSRSACCC